MHKIINGGTSWETLKDSCQVVAEFLHQGHEIPEGVRLWAAPRRQELLIGTWQFPSICQSSDLCRKRTKRGPAARGGLPPPDQPLRDACGLLSRGYSRSCRSDKPPLGRKPLPCPGSNHPPVVEFFRFGTKHSIKALKKNGQITSKLPSCPHQSVILGFHINQMQTLKTWVPVEFLTEVIL